MRRAVVEVARRTVADGLVVGTSGNVSARVGDTIVITPSGVPYERLDPAALPTAALTGRPAHEGPGESGGPVPSSELPLHLAVYRARPEARAVVHTHAVHATAVSTLVEEVPAVHYACAALGGPIRVAPYATYGTERLALVTVEALRDRTACLLANHGTIALGEERDPVRALERALERTAQLEWMCRVWLAASSVPGRAPALLPGAEIDRVIERLRGYGQPGDAA
ncbi:class II aldolase/adducin family protein [Streptomyces sp. ST2-7A]|nr:class II aldolase/adducin family protein [Streptomyces sp. ST2-7A]MCE7082232.1 class II aldolase/adducin family protein [Streptomyces sp. ST2-7A]